MRTKSKKETPKDIKKFINAIRFAFWGGSDIDFVEPYENAEWSFEIKPKENGGKYRIDISKIESPKEKEGDIRRPMSILMDALKEVEFENLDKIHKFSKMGSISSAQLHEFMVKAVSKKTRNKFDPKLIRNMIELQYPHDW